MSKPQGWIIVGCIAAVCACLCLAILDGRALIKAQFGVAQREDTKLRDLVTAQANQIEALVSDQMTGLRQDANAQLTAIRDGALKTEKDANDRTTEALAKIEEIRGDLRPVLDNAAAIEIHADTDLADARKATEHAVNPTEVAGFVRDSRFFMARAARAAGTVEQAGNDVDKALPPLLANAQLITDKFTQTEDQSQKLMAETTGTMANFRKATTPLPGWARVFFQIAPPAAQAGAALVGAGAVLGWFK